MAEIMEFPAEDDFKCLDIPFKEKAFRLKKDVLIAGILRDRKLIIPSGNTSISRGDRVIITTSRKNRIRSLNDMLNNELF